MTYANGQNMLHCGHFLTCSSPLLHLAREKTHPNRMRLLLQWYKSPSFPSQLTFQPATKYEIKNHTLSAFTLCSDYPQFGLLLLANWNAS